jgi:hypothetical protein
VWAICPRSTSSMQKPFAAMPNADKLCTMKRLIIISIIVLISLNLIGQTNQFIKFYGDYCPDFGLSLDMTDDGGYILLGHTENFGAQYQDMWLVKIDSIGNIEWYKLFGGTNLDFGQSIQITNDKGFILCGFTNSMGAGGFDIYVVKTDSVGNFQWQQTFGGLNNEYGYCIRQTYDKGFIICGSTTSFGSGGTDAILIKTDSSGNQQWSKYYGGANNDGAYSLDIAADSGYVLGGYSYNFGASADDAMIIKTDTAGNQQWLKIYGGTTNDRALCVKQCYDKGFCIAGYTNSYGSGSEDMYFVKTDSSGNLSYYKTYGGPLTDKAYSLDFTFDNGFILTGQTNSYGAGNNDLYVVKADSTGNMLWQKYYGGSLDDEGFTIKSTSDNGYIAIGNTLSFNVIYKDMYVVKMDSTGFATSINTFLNDCTDLNIFPNPTKDKVFIETDEHESSIISIINIDGQTIFQKTISKDNFEIDMTDFANGLYLLNIKTKTNNYSRKIIKE